jgi:hypothetical protein
VILWRFFRMYRYYRGHIAPKAGTDWNDYRNRPRKRRRALRTAWYYAKRGYSI